MRTSNAAAWLLVATVGFCPVLAVAAEPETLQLTVRQRTIVLPGPKEGEQWGEVKLKDNLVLKETAIVICDMWDDHWCKKAAARCGELAKKMNPVIVRAREKGIFIIHAPSECMSFYKDSPARKRMTEAPKVEMPIKVKDVAEPPLPCDTSTDGGCDDDPPSKFFKAWKRQHEALVIDEAKDGISDNGLEVYSAMKQRGIKNLLVMGVHTNMCILNRSFAIKAMTRAGVKCILVRDLTDAMYSPKSKPFVTHEEGTERIIQHIERYWCPSTTSDQIK